MSIDYVKGAIEVMEYARQAGIVLEAKADGLLSYRGHKRAISPQLVELLRYYKPHILEHLQLEKQARTERSLAYSVTLHTGQCMTIIGAQDEAEIEQICSNKGWTLKACQRLGAVH